MDDHTVVGRILAILDAAGPRVSISLAEIAAITGIPKSSVHRLAEDLTRRGALARTGDGYRLHDRIRMLADVPMPSAALASVEEALVALHERFGGIAWYSHRDDRLSPQPALVVADHRMRRLAASRWPDPTLPVTLRNTAIGNAVLAGRPDLLERVARDEGLNAGRARGLIADKISRGLDRGAFYDDQYLVTGWRCVAVRLGAKTHTGVIGVTVQGDRPRTRDLIVTTRRITEPLADRR